MSKIHSSRKVTNLMVVTVLVLSAFVFPVATADEGNVAEPDGSRVGQAISILYLADDGAWPMANDNGDEESWEAMYNAITASGYEFTGVSTWDKDGDGYLDDINMDGMEGPYGDGLTVELMDEYDLVIWDCGYDSLLLTDESTSLTNTDISNIIEYLNRGGNLWLMGGDIFADLLADVNSTLYLTPDSTSWDDYGSVSSMNFFDWMWNGLVYDGNFNTEHLGVTLLYYYLGVNAFFADVPPAFMVANGSHDIFGSGSETFNVTTDGTFLPDSYTGFGFDYPFWSDIVFPRDVDDSANESSILEMYLGPSAFTVMNNWSGNAGNGGEFNTVFSPFHIGDISNPADRVTLTENVLDWFNARPRESFQNDVALAAIYPEIISDVWADYKNLDSKPFGELAGVVGEPMVFNVTVANYGTTDAVDVPITMLAYDQLNPSMRILEEGTVSVLAGESTSVYWEIIPPTSGWWSIAAELNWSADENPGNDYIEFWGEEPRYGIKDVVKTALFYEDFEGLTSGEKDAWTLTEGGWAFIDHIASDPSPRNHSGDGALVIGAEGAPDYAEGTFSAITPYIDLSRLDPLYNAFLTFRITGDIKEDDRFRVQAKDLVNDGWVDMWDTTGAAVDISDGWKRPVTDLTSIGGDVLVGVGITDPATLGTNSQFRILFDAGSMGLDSNVYIDDLMINGIEFPTYARFVKEKDLYAGVPGQDTEMTFDILGFQDLNGTLELSATSDSGWTVVFDEDSITLDDTGMATVTMTVTVPTTGIDEDNYDFTVSTDGPTDEWDIETIFTITFKDIFEVEVTSVDADTTLTAVKGVADAELEFEVENLGTTTDTFDLEVTGLPTGWTISFFDGSTQLAGDPATISLAPLGTKTITATVTPKSDAMAPSTSDDIRIKVVSQGDDGVFDFFEFNVAVAALGVDLLPSPVQFGTVGKGVEVTKTFDVTNTGTQDDIYDLSFVDVPANIVSTIYDGDTIATSVAVAGGETETLTVKLTVASLYDLDTFAFNLKAVSQQSTAVMDTTSVEGTIVAFGIGVEPIGDVDMDVDPGDSVTFTVEVETTGDAQDTYLLSLDGAPATWTVTFKSHPTGTALTESDIAGSFLTSAIDVDGKAGFLVEVTVPATATASTETLTLTITSAGDPTVTTTEEFTATVTPELGYDFLFDVDIILGQSDIETTDLVKGTAASIEAEVYNAGPGDYDGSVTVRIYADSVVEANLLKEQTISGPHIAGEGKTRKVLWTPTQAGSHSIIVVIDPDNEIDELDETNNQATIVAVITEADDGGDDGGDGSPGFEGVALIAALGVALLIYRRK